MKSIFAILFFSATVAVSAQQPAAVTKEVQPASKVVEPTAACDLAVQYSPLINGLKLRMPEAEAALRLGTKVEADPADARRKRIASSSLEGNVLFEGDKVVAGSLTSVDEKVNSIRLTYARPWTNAKDFVNWLAPKLGVVRIGFRLDDEKREAKMTCKDFVVELRAAGPGSELIITETAGTK